MIKEEFCRKILFLGIDYSARGGVAAVESAYKSFIHPFNFISTVCDGSKLRKILILIIAIFKFVFFLLFKECKIVHVHGASNASFWRKRIFINIAKVFGKKIVYHIHGGGFEKFTNNHEKSVRKTLNKCDCIVALSEYWKDYFTQTLDCKSVFVIKNVIPAPQIDRKPHKKFVLLFMGLLVKEKGIYDLVEILGEYKNEYKDNLELIIGGNGNDKILNEAIVSRNVESFVHYVGWVSGQKKNDLFNTADAYILPSYIEGVPISILEAMSYGLPIISTRVGGIPEIVSEGKNGLLFDAGDKKSMKECIDIMLENKDMRTAMGENSSKMCKEHLPDHVSNQLEALYRSLL